MIFDLVILHAGLFLTLLRSSSSKVNVKFQRRRIIMLRFDDDTR